MLQGIKREQLQTTSQKKRLPITTNIMRSIKAILLQDPQSHHNIMMWAVCCTTFFGFLRCSEFTVPSLQRYDPEAHLSLDDVAIDSTSTPSLLKLTIKQSKTDPFSKGVDLYLGRTDTDVCPVQAMLPYLSIRGSRPGALFMTAGGKPLTRQYLVSSLSAILLKARLDDSSYNTHSFCIGAATSAKKAGISDSQIQMLGRWRSEAYRIYIRTPRERLARLSRDLAATK